MGFLWPLHLYIRGILGEGQKNINQGLNQVRQGERVDIYRLKVSWYQKDGSISVFLKGEWIFDENAEV